MQAIQIRGTGEYLPKRLVTAYALAEKLGIDEAWVTDHIGVQTRYFVDDETAVSMAAEAALKALDASGINKSQLDCIVCASGTPHQIIPSTASLIQRELGLGDSGIPAFDINSTCLSFLVALEQLSYPMMAGRYQNVLIVSSEVASVGLNWNDKESACLFGDGAAAVVVSLTPQGESSGILHSNVKTYGDGASMSQIEGGGTAMHASGYTAEEAHRYQFAMDGRGIFKLSARRMPAFFQQALDAANVTREELSLVIPHQASQTACRLMRQRLGLPEEKFQMIAHDGGNTIAASLPMGLHRAINNGRLQRGDLGMLLGTSAGLSLGALVFRY